MKLHLVPLRVLLMGGVLALAACASTPQPPLDTLQAADISVASAEKESGAEFAPLEMRTAREKLAAAHAAALKKDDKDMTESRRLADEARADADLATSKARLGKANAVNQELQKNGKALRQETQRNTGG